MYIVTLYIQSVGTIYTVQCTVMYSYVQLCTVGLKKIILKSLTWGLNKDLQDKNDYFALKLVGFGINNIFYWQDLAWANVEFDNISSNSDLKEPHGGGIGLFNSNQFSLTEGYFWGHDVRI